MITSEFRTACRTLFELMDRDMEKARVYFNESVFPAFDDTIRLAGRDDLDLLAFWIELDEYFNVYLARRAGVANLDSLRDYYISHIKAEM